MSYRESAAPDVDKTEVEKERIRQTEETKRQKCKADAEVAIKRLNEYGPALPVASTIIIAIALVAAGFVAHKAIDVRSSCREFTEYGNVTCEHPLHVRVGRDCKCGVPTIPVAPTVRVP